MCGSSTIAVALLAPDDATVWRSTCSAFDWIVWSSVSRTARPSRGATSFTTSIGRPTGSLTIVSLPGLPFRVRSSWSSIPARPRLSTPANPSTCAASRPCG